LLHDLLLPSLVFILLPFVAHRISPGSLSSGHRNVFSLELRPRPNDLALLRQLPGTGIGDPALGLLVARHDRPTLLINIAPSCPSIFVLPFDEFLALRRVQVELRYANRS